MHDEQFAEAFVRFVRAFGLHRPDRTPCGIEAGIAEAHTLSELSAGPLRQMDLVGRLHLSKSTVSRLVTGMVERGWVERAAAPSDGRGVLLDLTPSGSDAARRLARARRERLRALLEAVPETRRGDVIDVLKLMEEAARVSNAEHALTV